MAGYGAADWTITNGMATTLANTIASAIKTKEIYPTRDWDDVSEITYKCDPWELIKHTRSHIINHGRIDVITNPLLGLASPTRLRDG